MKEGDGTLLQSPYLPLFMDLIMNIRWFTSIKAQVLIGSLLIIGGIGLYALRGSNSLIHAEPTVPLVKATVWEAPKPTTISGNPVRVEIPSLKLALPIINGIYDAKTKTWTLAKDKVQYATMTPPPNNAEGNTFLYGHYRTGVFATLHTIKPGAQAVITTDNSHVFTYTFTGSRVTNQSDDSVFEYKGAPMLTIQTCTGVLFQYRQFFSFELTGVQ